MSSSKSSPKSKQVSPKLKGVLNSKFELVMNIEICDLHLNKLGLSNINWTTDGVSTSAISSQIIEGYSTYFYCKGELNPIFSKCLIKFMSQKLEFVSLSGRASQLLIDQLYSGSSNTHFEATLEGVRSDSRDISFYVDVGFAQVPTSIEQLTEENKFLKKQVHELEDAYSQLLNKKVENDHKRSKSADDAGLIGRILTESNLISKAELAQIQPQSNSDQIAQLAIKKIKRLRISSAELDYKVKSKEGELEDYKHQYLPELDLNQLPIKFGGIMYTIFTIAIDFLWKVEKQKVSGEDFPSSQVLTEWKKEKQIFKSPPTDFTKVMNYYLKQESATILLVISVFYYAHTNECKQLFDSCESHICDLGGYCYLNKILSAKTQITNETISSISLLQRTVYDFFNEGIFGTKASRDGLELILRISAQRNGAFNETLHNVLGLEEPTMNDKIEQ
jgi:hypothetical protein